MLYLQSRYGGDEIMNSAIQKWGNSIAVRLPKAVAEAVSVRKGSPVTIEARDGRILVTPVRKPVYRLESLTRAITKTNRHRSVEMGRPRGDEVW